MTNRQDMDLIAQLERLSAHGRVVLDDPIFTRSRVSYSKVTGQHARKKARGRTRDELAAASRKRNRR